MVRGNEKILIFGDIRPFLGNELMPLNTAQIELCAEQVPLKSFTEKIGLVGHQPAGRSRPQVGHGIQIGPRENQSIEHSMFLGINPSIQSVHQSVTLSRSWVGDKCGGEEDLAGGIKGHLYGIVHASTHHHITLGTIRKHAKEMGRRIIDGGAVKQGMLLPGKSALGPVNPSIGSKIRTMKIIGTPRQSLAIHPHFPTICLTIPIGILETKDLRRGCAVNRPLVTENALWKHQPISKNHAGII